MEIGPIGRSRPSHSLKKGHDQPPHPHRYSPGCLLFISRQYYPPVIPSAEQTPALCDIRDTIFQPSVTKC